MRALLDARVEESLSDADSHAHKIPSYDPGIVFLLELMLSTSMHGRRFIKDLWSVFPPPGMGGHTLDLLVGTLFVRPIVFGTLQDILSRAVSYSTLLVERAIAGLIRLCTLLVNEVCGLLL